MKYNKQTFSELPVHSSLMPPCIANFISGRKAVFTCGGPTIDIDDDVTLEDIMTKWHPKRFESKQVTISDRKDWSVQGKKSKYTVTFMNNNFSCSCPGYGFRRRCKHIEEIKSRYE
jgi:hypothetical protein